MDENIVTVKEVILNNNCPECYGKGGLILIFKQKIIETKFYKSIASDIIHDIKCKTCHNTIYPVQWTDDMERLVEYHQKAVSPMASSTYIKQTSWIIIAAIILLSIMTLLLIYFI